MPFGHAPTDADNPPVDRNQYCGAITGPNCHLQSSCVQKCLLPASTEGATNPLCLLAGASQRHHRHPINHTSPCRYTSICSTGARAVHHQVECIHLCHPPTQSAITAAAATTFRSVSTRSGWLFPSTWFRSDIYQQCDTFVCLHSDKRDRGSRIRQSACPPRCGVPSCVLCW